MACYGYTSEIWGPQCDRKPMQIPLPQLGDGVRYTIPVMTTATEARFFAALIAQAGQESINNAIDYAVSDRA